MYLKICNWIKTLWGRVTTFVIIVVAFMTLIDYLLKWQIYSYFLNTTWPCFKYIFIQDITTPIYLLFVLAVILLLLIFSFVQNKLKIKKYFVPTKDKFNNGYEPSEYSRKTKWNYKRNDRYYFVPLLSHSYNSVEFVDLCGPYCSKCDHILHINGSDDLGNKFVCVNCVKKYKIPKELLGDYQDKLFSYFREEYRQGKLKEIQ